MQSKRLLTVICAPGSMCHAGNWLAAQGGCQDSTGWLLQGQEGAPLAHKALSLSWLDHD